MGSRSWREARRLRTAVRAARMRKTADGTVNAESLRKLFSGASCTYCGVRLRRSNRVADHVVPLGLGGKHRLANLAPSCRTCNKRKGVDPAADFRRHLVCYDCSCPLHRGTRRLHYPLIPDLDRTTFAEKKIALCSRCKRGRMRWERPYAEGLHLLGPPSEDRTYFTSSMKAFTARKCRDCNGRLTARNSTLFRPLATGPTGIRYSRVLVAVCRRCEVIRLALEARYVSGDRRHVRSRMVISPPKRDTRR